MDFAEAKKIFSVTGNVFSADELKSRYRKLIGESHPDRFMNLDPSLRLIKELLTQKINLAYEVLKRRGVASASDATEPFLQVKIRRHTIRPRVHPRHKDESFRHLWWKIHTVSSQGNEALACALLNVSLVYLLGDFKKYPDLDGVIHNFIRDYARLLRRCGAFRESFYLIRIAVAHNVLSYYEFYPPTRLLKQAVLDTWRSDEAVDAWERMFLGSVGILDVSAQWAMVYSFYHRGEYIRLLNHIESGHIIPAQLRQLPPLPSNADESQATSNIILAMPKDCRPYCGLLLPEIRVYRYGLLRLLMQTRSRVDIEDFATRYPITHSLIEQRPDKNLDKDRDWIAACSMSDSPAGKGFVGLRKRRIGDKDYAAEAQQIFEEFIKISPLHLGRSA